MRKRPDLRPLSRHLKNIPLWERPAPKYPLYRPGNPQTRLFLPQFWMKILRDERNRAPPNSVHFEVHREMGKSDIQQYLEKIYQVKVLKIRTYTIEGKDAKERAIDESWLRSTFITTDFDRKFAYVTLEGTTFDFPAGITEGYTKKFNREEKEMSKHKLKDATDSDTRGIPDFFIQ
ncbi:large ribosomal subunit protein uL23m-like [Saccostrea cucullata]|uniref:large ribosomal subunit protein uL23m-like n=1 Tax=Saccostrea cuccullata TaxID=36930 RepID=UPI002ED38F4C